MQRDSFFQVCTIPALCSWTRKSQLQIKKCKISHRIQSRNSCLLSSSSSSPFRNLTSPPEAGPDNVFFHLLWWQIQITTPCSTGGKDSRHLTMDKLYLPHLRSISCILPHWANHLNPAKFKKQNYSAGSYFYQTGKYIKLFLSWLDENGRTA